MSTDLVHFLTVIGDAASGVEEACEELLGRRVEVEPHCYGSEDWSGRDHLDLADLCVTLLAAARSLPVLHHSQFLDGWSTGGLALGLPEWPDGRRRVICGDGYDLTYYSSSCRETFASQLRSRRRTKIYRTSSETRQYWDHLKEAFDTPRWLDRPFLVAVIHQCLGPTRHDEDIEAMLSAPLSPRDFGKDIGDEPGRFLPEFRAERCGRKVFFGNRDS